MTKEEIIQQMSAAHAEFVAAVRQLSPEDFEFTPEGKWSAAQQTEHLLTSTKALKPAFKIPKFILKQRFGVANRPSRSYDEVVQRYTDKLAAGGRATGAFIPDAVSADKRDSLLTGIAETVEKLNKGLAKWSEEHIDEYILPHPLLGKITVREMMYFTIHHVQHHQNIIDRELAIRDEN